VIKKERATVRARTSERMNYQLAVNVLTNYVLPKKYTKKSDQEYRTINIVFSAKTATRTITTTSIVNFANRFTPTVAKMKMTINGSAAIAVRDGIT